MKKEKNNSINIILMLFACILMISCDKEEDEDPPAANNNTTEMPNDNAALQFDGADGFCAAVKSATSYEPIPGTVIDIAFGTAVAAMTNDDFANYVDVGAVNCEAEDLTKQANNSYVHTYTYDPTNPSDLGIEFSDNASWVVDGGNGIAGFSYTTTVGFPTVGNVIGEDVVDRSQDYTLAVSNISNADSIIYQVGDVLEIVAGNVTSYTFSAAQLADVPTGPSISQVTGYRWEETIQGDKVIYFINEEVKSKSVTVQ